MPETGLPYSHYGEGGRPVSRTGLAAAAGLVVTAIASSLKQYPWSIQHNFLPIVIVAVQAYSIQNNIQYIGWRALARLPASMTPSYSLGEHVRNDVRTDIRPPHPPVPYFSDSFVQGYIIP